jgi:hypothetical protein
MFNEEVFIMISFKSQLNLCQEISQFKKGEFGLRL